MMMNRQLELLELRQRDEELGNREQEIEAREIAARTPRTTPRWTRKQRWRSVIVILLLVPWHWTTENSNSRCQSASWSWRRELVMLEAGVVLCQAEFVQREELAVRLEEVEPTFSLS